MRSQSAKCPNCGASVVVDLETKAGVCEYCGSQVFLTRDDIMGSDVVRNNMDLALKYFKEKDIKNAVHYAEQIISYVPDSAVGLFITAFERAFLSETKYQNAMKEFYTHGITNGVMFDEIKDLLLLTRLSLIYLIDCEKEVLNFVIKYCQPQTAQVFLESYLPVSIAKRGGSEWLDEELANVYKRLVSAYNLPKTVFALYTTLTESNDSPEKVGNYNVITSVRIFLDEYCARVGSIIDACKDTAMRDKFKRAFTAKVEIMRNKYELQKAKLEKYRAERN